MNSTAWKIKRVITGGIKGMLVSYMGIGKIKWPITLCFFETPNYRKSLIMKKLPLLMQNQFDSLRCKKFNVKRVCYTVKV